MIQKSDTDRYLLMMVQGADWSTHMLGNVLNFPIAISLNRQVAAKHRDSRGRQVTTEILHCSRDNVKIISCSPSPKCPVSSSNAPRTRQRSRYSASTESTESNDSNDSDYQVSDHVVGLPLASNPLHCLIHPGP